ncbi:MAG: LLM class flavin-dependent oxidoreductase, partial [Thermoleophilia bacterium]|nr:LLM class flavin-dependent oxidoreductase [Thermoleophilia bacterium]
RPRPALGINGHGHLADTSQEAADAYYPSLAQTMDRIGRERGWPPHTRADYDRSLDLRGHLLVGSPQQVVEKILFQHEVFGHDRVLIQLTVGSMPHAKTMRAIELLGTEVAPAVRAALGRERRGEAEASPRGQASA